MKAGAICILIAGGIFLAGLLQLGVLRPGSGSSGSADPAKSEPKPPKAKFPDDLMPAAQAKPVEKAAAYKVGLKLHKMVFMTPTGELHDWHEQVTEDWIADTVEETELVVVVGKQRRTLIQSVPYQNGPPINRVRFEVEVSVVEAKTGTVLDNRLFRNEPRVCRDHEPYRTTMIGTSVRCSTVFDWISKKSKIGFPEDEGTFTVITVID